MQKPEKSENIQKTEYEDTSLKSKFLSKLDLKTLFILILSIVCLVFFSMWYFGGSNYKSENKTLKDQNKALQNERDELKKEREKLEAQQKTIEDNIKQKEKALVQINDRLLKSQEQLSRAMTSLYSVTVEYQKTQTKINELEDHPIRRDGDALLNSLREKTK